MEEQRLAEMQAVVPTREALSPLLIEWLSAGVSFCHVDLILKACLRPNWRDRDTATKLQDIVKVDIKLRDFWRIGREDEYQYGDHSFSDVVVGFYVYRYQTLAAKVGSRSRSIKRRWSNKPR